MESDPRAEDSPLPNLLHSVQRGGPFAACDSCGTDLTVPDSMYVVSKVWRGGEVIFECALCAACVAELWSEFSEESRERIEAQSLDSGPANTLPAGDFPVACGSCGAAFDREDETAERALVGIVAGSELAQITAVCRACNERVDDLLSRPTRETLEGFSAHTFPGVGAELDLPAGLFGAL